MIRVGGRRTAAVALFGVAAACLVCACATLVGADFDVWQVAADVRAGDADAGPQAEDAPGGDAASDGGTPGEAAAAADGDAAEQGEGGESGALDSSARDVTAVDVTGADVTDADVTDADGGADGGLDAPAEGASDACNSLALPDAGVPVVYVALPPPALTGGTLPQSALFVLTADTYYTDAGPQDASWRQQALQLSGDTIQSVWWTEDAGVLRSTVTVSPLGDAGLGVTFDCLPPGLGDSGAQEIGYSIIGDGGRGTLWVITGDLREFQTFTQQ
jgi:hypothetical protein